MFKLVHYKVCTAIKWVVGILLECYLVLTLSSYAKSHSTRKHSSRMRIACLVTATGRRGGYPRSHAQRRGWVPTWTYPPIPWNPPPQPPQNGPGTWHTHPLPWTYPAPSPWTYLLEYQTPEGTWYKGYPHPRRDLGPGLLWTDTPVKPLPFPQLRWRAVITKTLKNTYFPIKCV